MNTHAPFQFGIASLLLITTLVAVVMSVSVMAPGVGIFLAIVTVPALLRTYISVRRRREENKSASNGEKVMLFLLCLGIAALILIATGAAFFFTCLAAALATSGPASRATGLAIGMLVGGGVSLTLLILLFRLYFKRPRKKLTTVQKEAAVPMINAPPDREP